MVYAQIFKLGFDLDRFVGNALISAFGYSEFMKSAYRVFDESSEKDTILLLGLHCLMGIL